MIKVLDRINDTNISSKTVEFTINSVLSLFTCPIPELDKVEFGLRIPVSTDKANIIFHSREWLNTKEFLQNVDDAKTTFPTPIVFNDSLFLGVSAELNASESIREKFIESYRLQVSTNYTKLLIDCPLVDITNKGTISRFAKSILYERGLVLKMALVENNRDSINELIELVTATTSKTEIINFGVYLHGYELAIPHVKFLTKNKDKYNDQVVFAVDTLL